jgi:hypothetical protein
MKEKIYNLKKKALLTPYMNEVDYFNDHGDFIKIFENNKAIIAIDSNVVKNTKTGQIFHKQDDGYLYEYRDNDTKNYYEKYTMFQILTHIRFKDAARAAMNYVRYEIMGTDVPYIRVGDTYYLKSAKNDPVHGYPYIELLSRDKSTLIDDHGKEFIQRVPKFDNFTIEPDNINYQEWIGNDYNLYNRFPHIAASEPGTFDAINQLLVHIFGEQIKGAYQYFRALYLEPKQILPILVLVSKERETGKTTFLEFMQMLFGRNFIDVHPEDLLGSFNALWAKKNIVAVDEAFFDKKETLERIKKLSTGAHNNVNEKNIKQYVIPSYLKLVLTSNNETDFIRVDSNEERFWIRKISKFKSLKNKKDVFDQMKSEIPYFLYHLQSIERMPNKSRMMFGVEDIRTEALTKVFEQSKSGLEKELRTLLEAHFIENGLSEIVATAGCIKNKFFEYNNKYSVRYISDVIKNEMGYDNPVARYTEYDSKLLNPNKPVGKFFRFLRNEFVTEAKDQSETLDNFVAQIIDPELPF